jgi:hypothetical protein
VTVRLYRSEDASAPVLNGNAGSLIAVLDACLVNGYGAKAAAGWGKAFSGTNKAAYRAAAGNRHYCRIDDTGTTSARIRGYEVLTDVDTGTGPFPTDAQQSGGAYVFKSSAANSTAVSWVLLANEKIFYLVVVRNAGQTMDVSVSYCPTHCFGEPVSYKAGDAYHSLLIANTNSSDQSSSFGSFAAIGSSTPGHWWCRSYTQVGSSVTVGKQHDFYRANTSNEMGRGGAAYPDPITGGILLSPVFLSENVAVAVRGLLPGVWAPLHLLPAAPLDTFSGTGELAGKTFLFVDTASGNNRARAALEISDTW